MPALWHIPQLPWASMEAQSKLVSGDIKILKLLGELAGCFTGIIRRFYHWDQLGGPPGAAENLKSKSTVNRVTLHGSFECLSEWFVAFSCSWLGSRILPGFGTSSFG